MLSSLYAIRPGCPVPQCRADGATAPARSPRSKRRRATALTGRGRAVVLVALGLALCGTTPANASQFRPASAPGQLYGLSGTVKAVSAAGHSFVVKSLTHDAVFRVGGTYTILTTSTTRFLSATMVVSSFSEIAPGEVVVTTVTDQHGTFRATEVAISQPAIAATTGHLPAGFPKDVPLPPGYKVLSAEAPRAGGHQSFLLALEVPGSVPGVTTAYVGQLTSAGYQVIDRRVVDGISSVEAEGSWLIGAAIKSGAGQGVPAGDVVMSLNVEPTS
ncbi:MAG TPA: hypothetical protein VME46_01135 [Acidimicrobiales bacterium]|nr:hypothetical protein [Acidimicrobiales bacterium]